MQDKKGLYLFSAGQSWEIAFQRAADFLLETDGILLLGPGIGRSAQDWLKDQILLQKKIFLGNRIFSWPQWVEQQAREKTLQEGRSFRTLNDPAKRSYFRSILATLTETNVFFHLQDLWKEEKFFTGLLACVEEARLAGLCEEAALERAKNLLARDKDAITREAYEDFWSLLLAYEAGLLAQGDCFDFSLLLRKALPLRNSPKQIFFLGFDHLSLLEVDLVQSLAKESEVTFPLALSSKELVDVYGEKEIPEALPGGLAQALCLGMSSVHLEGEIVEENPLAPHFLLMAGSPAEEIRSAAAFGRSIMENGGKIRFVVPKKFASPWNKIFQEELGSSLPLFPKKLLSVPLARLFHQSIQMKEKNYALSYGIELAQLLQYTKNSFYDLPALAQKAGVREGLGDWQLKADQWKDPSLKEFSELLNQVDRLLPNRGHCGEFAAALIELSELFGLAALAKDPGREREKDIHGALGQMFRQAHLLAASIKEKLDFKDWLKEWTSILKKTEIGVEFGIYPNLEIYEYGNWLPPAQEEQFTVALRWDGSILPSRSFSFFLEESARRKLRDLRFPTQIQEELSFYDSMERFSRNPNLVFSWSCHTEEGKDLEPFWMASALPLVSKKWPEVARPFAGDHMFLAKAKVVVQKNLVQTFSASLLERYKECPFKAFVLNVLRLEEKMQSSSLDISSMELGNLVHRTLEIFYGEKKGKGKTNLQEILESSIEQAVSENPVEYFKGGGGLFQFEIERLKTMMFNFLVLEEERYRSFPDFGDPAVERKVFGKIGDHTWRGKIDKIDLDPKSKKFLVIDYKIGTTPQTKEILENRRFQLQMYLDAVEKEYPDYEPIGASYLSLKYADLKQGLVRKKFNRTKKSEEDDPKYFEFHSRTGSLKSEEEFEEIRKSSRHEISRLADEIQSGFFDVRPFDRSLCGSCEVRPACRINQISAPAMIPWPRKVPDFSFLHCSPELHIKKKSGRGTLNPEQEMALARNNGLVFLEASAGTGKTTVLVEKILRFFLEKLKVGEPTHVVAESFLAISFTDKSAQELASRVSRAMMEEPGLGSRVAAQAVRQISTIHGLCRRILMDFPLEAGISPMATLMDEKESEVLLDLVFDEFFLNLTEIREPLTGLTEYFSRKKIEGFLRTFLGKDSILHEDFYLYESWLKGEISSPGNLLVPGEERTVFSSLIFLYRKFQELHRQRKRDRNVLDFNDLESLSLRVLERAEVQAFYKDHFSLIIVDEFQDTNSVQRKILERIARANWDNLFVVGDAKQSIYRFRAADVSVFQRLRKEAEESGKLFSLFRNYRSRKELVQMANQVTQRIFPKSDENPAEFEAVAALSESFRSEGGYVRLLPVGSGDKLNAVERRREESILLVKSIQEELRRGRAAESIAVLFRKLSGNEVYLNALTAAGIPYRVGSSRGFFSQAVILDGIALLRAVYGERNELALLSVLRSPWIRKSDEEIVFLQRRNESGDLWEKIHEQDAPFLYSMKKMAPFSNLSDLLCSAYDSYPMGRWEYLQSQKLLFLLRLAEEDGEPKAAILERFSQWAGWDREEDCMDTSTMPDITNGGGVQIMTIHSAKGLEFDITFLPDLVSAPPIENSSLRILPGIGISLSLDGKEKSQAFDAIRTLNKERELAETKRLLYVAITRAKDGCVFLLPKIEKKEGKDPSTWAEMLIESGIGDVGSLWGSEGTLVDAAEPIQSVHREKEFVSDFLLETSISELAALQFCGEFHRKKFVQGWDDQVQELWNRSKPLSGISGSIQQKREMDPRKKATLKILRSLGIESKERGIALHRVLERTEGSELDSARLWLRDAYLSQGAIDGPSLEDLLKMDLEVLGRFLSSALGKELFGKGVEAYAEIPFLWKIGDALLHGTMDRLVRRGDLWTVVDYKSSVQEDSLNRYEFQVASYMAAVETHLLATGKENFRVEGYLVDLVHSTFYPVERDHGSIMGVLRKQLVKIRQNYTLTDDGLRSWLATIEPGEHCFSCPYSLDCDLGKNFVLSFKN